MSRGDGVIGCRYRYSGGGIYRVVRGVQVVLEGCVHGVYL